MSFSSAPVSGRATALVVAPFLVLALLYACLWMPEMPAAFFRSQELGAIATEIVAPKDELEAALEGASMENRTLIIAVLNKAYVEENAMLDLFLQSLREGEDTQFLIRHVLFVAVDERAFNRCRSLELHCYKFVTDGADISEEVFYMSKGFNDMMWRRTLFLGDVLRRGYSFIFTDMDVMWVRNPFQKLHHEGEDLLVSCGAFHDNPLKNSNINTGFYFATPNNKTIALFDEWYASRNYSERLKDQDVLQRMVRGGVFERLGLKVRYLETRYFSGFCQMSKDFREVVTIHANCCVRMKVKMIRLRNVLECWKMNNWNRTANATWPPVKGICLHGPSPKH
ncbi:hypothetical protein Cni_G25477 [Canna indica]|uniref:Nucleotide-diphospho-sugar transferase domain-containing protein n=1 Tax=Canna indica TaxID=4628 RepID=A0AAQ3KXS6_9LILI|nr:hypothetical protein Cni_G25477 [Canna indica]